MLTRYFPTAIIRTIINKALKRRVHVTDVQREPWLLKKGNGNEMEDGLRAE